MQKHVQWFLLILLFGCFLFLNNDSFAGHNLPQVKSTVPIKGKQHQALRKFFFSLGDAPDELDAPIEKILVSNLPKQYQTGCKQMISQWGSKAKGTDGLLPRAVYLKAMDDGIMHVFIVYTCYSTVPEFGDTYYDERLAVLTIDKSSSSLTMLPFSLACDNCSELSRMGVGDDSLHIDGLPTISIVTAISHDNPCCKGLSTIYEKSLHYLVLTPRTVMSVGSSLEYRKEIDHLDGGVDSTTEYSATRFFTRDHSGNITTIISNYEVLVNDQLTKRGTKTLAWNKKRKAFDDF